jgi:hypothetical protein
MDPARAAFGTVGCAAQIELGKVARFEWQPHMRRGREQRNVCGLGGGTRARRNGERWREIYRDRRLHQARLGNIGEAASALDSQAYRVFLIAHRALPGQRQPASGVWVQGLTCRCRALHARRGPGEPPTSQGRRRLLLNVTRHRRNVKSLQRHGALNKFVVVIPINKSKETKQ